MKIETREIYKCEFCRKLYQIKKWAVIHENGCSKNPANFRKCYGCVHLHKTEADYTFDTYCGEETESVSVLHCKAKDVYIHPPKVEAKKNWFDFGDKANEPMPMECDLYEWEYAVDIMQERKNREENERFIIEADEKAQQ